MTSQLKGLPARRRKIANACDFCREHRVRCEAVTPCPQCVANKITCNRSRSSHTSKRTNTIRSKHTSDLRSPNPPPRNIPLAAALPSPEAQIPTPSPSENLVWRSHKTDSILGFIARMDAFCSSVPEISPSSTFIDGPHLNQNSALPTINSQHAQHAECDLSVDQIKHLMRIFWTRLQSRMPILQPQNLRSSDDYIRGTSSPLQDAIIAYSLHSVYCSGLYKRLVGLSWPHFYRQDGATGMPYFQRALSAISQFTTFERPTLSTMQCYCYLSQYLLDIGHHQAAYNIVGLGLRISQSLNYMDERHGGYRECQLFRRVWWTLIHLDFRCSRHVGKPVSTNIDELIHLLPSREPQDVHHLNGLLYHNESIRLTAAALAVNNSMACHSSLPRDETGNQAIEARAQIISQSLYHVERWQAELPKEGSFAIMQFGVPDILPNPADTASLEDQHTEHCPAIALFSASLKIQYHNIMVGLHRVFIQFPNYPLVPKSTPTADAHAATALNHALMMIHITHQAMKVQDSLHGISELYQYLWNAVITTIGFMLAYPYCHRCPRAKQYLYLALEIFDFAGDENCTAKRAAVLIRQSMSKVDALIQMLELTRPINEASLSGAPTNDTPSIVNTTSQSAGSGSQGDEFNLPFGPEVDMLGSWTDMINLDAWPSYCNEVNEAFMGPSELFSALDA